MLPYRFWSKVDIRGHGECWPWLGCAIANPAGAKYGRFRLGGSAKMAHRCAYLFAKGDIPDGMLIRHICDNSICCNPEHLETGAHTDNARDKYERGRAVHLNGKRLPQAKFKEDDVRGIRLRAANGESKAAIAREYGVTVTAVRYAINKGWRHVA